jgi:hypothetical protein
MKIDATLDRSSTTRLGLFSLLCLFTAASSTGVACGGYPAIKPPIDLSIVHIPSHPGGKDGWAFVLGNVAYRSAADLKASITLVPRGTSIRWMPNCLRMGGEPLTTEAELIELRSLCAVAGVRFVIVPAG